LYNSESDDNNESDIPYESGVQMADILENLYGQFSGSPLSLRSRPTPANNGTNVGNSSTTQSNENSDFGAANSSTSRQRHNAGADSDPQSPQSRQRTRYFQFNFPRGSDAGGFDNQQSLEGYE